jgi:hypothetical protein
MTRTEFDPDQSADRVIGGIGDKVAALHSARGHYAAQAFNRDQSERLAQMRARQDHRISEIANPIVREGVRRHLANIREMS